MKRSPLLVIFLTVALDLVGFGIIIPLLPLYAKELGASGTLISVLFASYSLMQFIFAPVWGRISDRIGRRPVLMASIAGNALALVLFGFARSFWLLLAARLIAGFCTATIGVANAYIADVTAPENRAKGMGLIGAAFGIGFVIGPFLGGELSTWGYSAPIFLAAGLSGLNFLLAWFGLPESLPPERRSASLTGSGGPTSIWAQRFGIARTARTLRPLFGLVFLQVMAFSMLEMAFVLFANRRLGFDVKHCGRVFFYIGLLMVLVQGGLIGRLVQRFGERTLVWVGLGSVALGMSLIPLTPMGGVAWLIAFVTFVSLGQGLLNPSLMSMLSRRAARDQQGLALGLSQSLSALARVTGPLTAGVLYDMGTEDTPFHAGGALMFVALGLAILWLSRMPEESGAEDSSWAAGATRRTEQSPSAQGSLKAGRKAGREADPIELVGRIEARTENESDLRAEQRTEPGTRMKMDVASTDAHGAAAPRA